MQFMIGWYGGGNRKIHGGYSLFVYTLFGSQFVSFFGYIGHVTGGIVNESLYRTILVMTTDYIDSELTGDNWLGVV